MKNIDISGPISIVDIDGDISMEKGVAMHEGALSDMWEEACLFLDYLDSTFTVLNSMIETNHKYWKEEEG